MRERVGLNIQKEDQVLWRSVIRSTGTTLLWILILLVLGGMYLAVSVKTASAGRTYLDLEDKVEEASRINSDLVVNLSDLTSPQRMMELASSMGFRPATSKDVLFEFSDVTVEDEVFNAPKPRLSLEDRKTTLSPAFTETLIDAFNRWWDSGGVK
jgi:cell division protein FtsL